MKTKKTILQGARIIFVAAVALLGTAQLMAQSVKKTFSYDLTLLGSSNIHDWKMVSSGSGLEANFVLDPGTKQLQGIQPLTMNMPVKSLKSTEGLLNSRAYNALNADKFPNFTYKLVSATASDNTVTLNGQLTVAGNTRDFQLVATQKKAADGTTTLTGTKKFKMTELGVKPPKYMMGMMKVYDDLTLNYNVRF